MSTLAKAPACPHCQASVVHLVAFTSEQRAWAIVQNHSDAMRKGDSDKPATTMAIGTIRSSLPPPSAMEVASWHVEYEACIPIERVDEKDMSMFYKTRNVILGST